MAFFDKDSELQESLAIPECCLDIQGHVNLRHVGKNHCSHPGHPQLVKKRGCEPILEALLGG